MSRVFYFNEIIKFAIEKEDESIALYKNLAEKINDETARKIFLRLEDEEKKHKLFYSEMLDKDLHEELPEFLAGEDYDAYMRDLIATSRTAIMPEINVANLNAILDFAVMREKDSVIFYVGLKNYLDQKMQAKVDLIIKQEAKHAAIILAYKHNLKCPI